MAKCAQLWGWAWFEFGDRDGEGHLVRLQHPLGITNKDGALYVADTYNHKIKLIMPVPRSSRTLVGTGKAGYLDGGPMEAAFSEPSGLSIADGKIFIADTNNHQIREADMETLQVTTLELSWPD